MGIITGGVAAASNGQVAPGVAPKPHSWLNRRQRIYWYDQYALNEQETAFAKYDPDRIAAEMKNTGADIVAVYAANQFSVAYYPSQVWPMLCRIGPVEDSCSWPFGFYVQKYCCVLIFRTVNWSKTKDLLVRTGLNDPDPFTCFYKCSGVEFLHIYRLSPNICL